MLQLLIWAGLSGLITVGVAAAIVVVNRRREREALELAILEDVAARVDALDGVEHAGPVMPGGKRGFHLVADGFPFGVWNEVGDAAVGEDFDLMVDELDVDKDAVGFAGGGDAEGLEEGGGALAGGFVVE